MAAEKKFENEIKSFLHTIGIYPLGTPKHKMKTKMIGYYEKRWGNAYTASGLPDLHIVINGISVEVEIKAKNGKPSELQKHKLSQIIESGAIGIILYPDGFEQFKELMLSLKETKFKLTHYLPGGYQYEI